MRKILYIITLSELGGAQIYVRDLARLLKDKYEILVATGTDGGGYFFKILDENGVKYTKLHRLRRAIKPLSDIAAIFEIKALIKKERPDIVHLNSSKAGVIGSLAARLVSPRPKIIYTVHGAVFEAPFKSFWRWLFLRMEKCTARFKDKIICVSENDKKLWLKNKAATEQKLTVIHNGIDYASFEFLPKEIAREKLLAAIPRYENPPQPPFIKGGRREIFTKGGYHKTPPFVKGGLGRILIGSIANFYPEKGLPYLIPAAAEILRTHENVIFLVIGEGFQRPLLEEMIEELKLKDKFILTGKIENAPKYLKAFDIFVLPSVKEGLPYTILEAMAAGLPIVASYVGGIPEIIENEKNGFLVLPRNSEMLAKKITELLDNPALADHFAQNSQTKLAEFSLEKMIGETEKIYGN